jgi:hypothetical protein
MAWDFVQWILRGGRLPPGSDNLIAALTQTSYGFQGDRLILEPKQDIRRRLGFSPDEMDAAMMTFHSPVLRRGSEQHSNPGRFESEYSPFAASWSVASGGVEPRTWSGIGGLR